MNSEALSVAICVFFAWLILQWLAMRTTPMGDVNLSLVGSQCRSYCCADSGAKEPVS